jgi:phosphomevalonate kinase
MEVTASAPGKVFLAGEYGVLLGGPALIAAVDLRLACRARVHPGRGRVGVRNGPHAATVDASDDAGNLRPEVRFAAIAALAAIRRLGRTDLDVAIETASDLDRESAKRGLGGSAAVVAATIGALYRALGRGCDASDLRERAALGVEAHRLAQGGGSGADVLAATVGGVVLADGLDAGDVPSGIAACRGSTAVDFERLELPQPLVLEVVATGRPAASGPRARRFMALARAADDSRSAILAWCDGMRAAVLALAAGCRSADAAAVAAATDRSGDLLERLGAIAAIPILTAELRAAVRVAREVGAAARPSGAGGGDCAIALVPEGRRDELRARWSAIGLEPLRTAIAGAGARVEESVGLEEVAGGAS